MFLVVLVDRTRWRRTFPFFSRRIVIVIRHSLWRVVIKMACFVLVPMLVVFIVLLFVLTVDRSLVLRMILVMCLVVLLLFMVLSFMMRRVVRVPPGTLLRVGAYVVVRLRLVLLVFV